MKPLVCILVVAMLVVPASAQSGQQLMVTVRLAGAVQDKGGAYYIAFTVSDSLLAGPQPDSNNWTHYVVYREGRFFFGTVPVVSAAQPFGFVAVRPPAPFIYGQVLPDRQTLRITLPLADLGIGPLSSGRLKINFVTVDEQNRALDALGPGANDRLVLRRCGEFTTGADTVRYSRISPTAGSGGSHISRWASRSGMGERGGATLSYLDALPLRSPETLVRLPGDRERSILWLPRGNSIWC
jgi:hypothetical protein